MSDATYDAIVVGGGQHGLITACYLQKAGLQTVIFERLGTMGGAMNSREGPAPGFTLNGCSSWTRFYSHPAYTEFNLRDKGLEYVFPEGSEVMIFDDETCLVGYSALAVVDPITGKTEVSQANLQKTLHEISRFSKTDAATAEELFGHYLRKWRAAFGKYRFSPPAPWGQKNALEVLCDDPDDGIDPVHQFMTCQQLAYDLFESEELRTLFMRAAMTSNGFAPHDVIGLYGLVHTLGMVLSWEPPAIPKGGTQSITNALCRAFTEMGGEYLVNSEVSKLLIQNGRAAGIRLKNGSEIKAQALVVSDLSAYQTICELVGEEHVSPKIIRRIKNIRYDRHNIIWANFAVHELPQYRAVSFNSDCGPQPRIYIGPKNADYVATRYLAEIFTQGISNRLYMFVGTDSIWDSSRAPEGKHILGVEEISAPTRFFPPSRWKELKQVFEDAIIQEWQHYAPNMTRDNVIAAQVTTPYDIQNRHVNMHQGSISVGDMILSQQDRFRPIPEMSQYRTPIENFYLASAAAHCGIGVGRGSSYCCFQTIAADLGL